MKYDVWTFRNIFVIIFTFLTFCVTNNGGRQAIPWLEKPELLPLYYQIRSLINAVGESIPTVKSHDRFKIRQDKVPDNVPFPCDVRGARSNERPTSVHKLRVGDIDVIGAIGDSLTAGNGALATNLLELLTEYRGVVWSIGGKSNWREFLTLPNILKEFNPNLIGYSYDHGLPVTRASQFNVAALNAMSDDLMFMGRELERRIRNDARVNFTDDWKMITVMIGSNDICNLCYLKDADKTPEMHRKDLLNLLYFIRDKIPRTFVNLVIMPDLNVLLKSTLHGFCDLTHTFECPCLYGLHRKPTLEKYLKLLYKWQDVQESVANMDEFKNNETFTVVPQLFLKRVVLPKKNINETDERYLSVDCFHISQRGYARGANGLWNNLLEPIQNKSVTWPEKLFEPFLCPTEEHPYFCTAKNNCQ